MGVSEVRGTILGIPITRIIVFGGLYWGPHIYGNCQIPVNYQAWGSVHLILRAHT